MKIIISPAKKMNEDTCSLPYNNVPVYIDDAIILQNHLKNLDYDTLKSIWKCNDTIAQLNFNRINNSNLHKNLSPAILTYEGIQYKHIAPSVFENKEFDYIENHLRILSGFYGILKPFDGIVPYRLEMGAKFDILNHKNLYEFWSDKLAKELCKDNDLIINLASKEYSKAIEKHLPKNMKFITCIFGQIKNNKIVEKSTEVKSARGEMVRFMANNSINNTENMKNFSEMNFHFNGKFSNENTLAFTL